MHFRSLWFLCWGGRLSFQMTKMLRPSFTSVGEPRGYTCEQMVPVQGTERARALVRQTSPLCSSRLTVRGLVASPGELYIGGQEHFYLETHCTIAVPKGEAGEMELFVSTQNTMKTQVGVLWVSSGAWEGHQGGPGRPRVAIWGLG